MARKPAPPTKSETLSIRLDPKTRFVLEYVSRLKGQTITTIVERAIVAAADELKIEDSTTYGGELTWRNFWDVSEGVRALRISNHTSFYPTYEEDRRRVFTDTHWPFFYLSAAKKGFNNHYIDVLWPRIDEFVQLHEDNLSKNHSAAAEAMLAALSDAKIQPPKWPPDPPPKPPKPPTDRVLDDDIPF